METSISTEFITQAVKRINQNTEKVETCLRQLNEKDLWFSPNGHLNSIGNLMLHLCGNMLQHIILHFTEHYSYHTGQIIFLTKLLKNIDLGFYAGIDLNKKNDWLQVNTVKMVFLWEKWLTFCHPLISWPNPGYPFLQAQST